MKKIWCVAVLVFCLGASEATASVKDPKAEFYQATMWLSFEAKSVEEVRVTWQGNQQKLSPDPYRAKRWRFKVPSGKNCYQWVVREQKRKTRFKECVV